MTAAGRPLDSVAFAVAAREDGSTEVVVTVNGRPLIELIEEYEAEGGMQPAGAYGGLVVDRFPFGDPRLYFTGDASVWPDEQRPLLGCDCGEWGCWPLLARVTTDGDRIVWSDFSQPYRPTWDHSGFGPFTFDARQVQHAVAVLSPG